MRAVVAEAVRGGVTRLRTASAPALIGLLAASAFVPVVAGPVSGMVTAGVSVLGSVGANVLTDVLTGAIGRLRPDASEADVRQALASRVEAAFASTDPRDQPLRAEVIALFEAFDIAGTALQTAAGLADAELLPRMVGAFAELTATFGDFGAVLVGTRLDVQALHRDLRREIARQSADRERFRQAEADMRRLLDAVHDLRRPEPADVADPNHPRRWDGCPYLGLLPFDERHTAIFYGRRALTDSLLDRIGERLSLGGILLVIGPSGAGKSSLLRAGLLAAVADDRLTPGSRTWPRRAITPTGDPVANLATHLADLSGSDAAGVYGSLTAHPENAHLLAAQAVTGEPREGAEPPRLVLIVDQLEELFTLGADAARQRVFLSALAAMAGGPAPGPPLTSGHRCRPALVVAGIRGDFLDQATAFAPLARAAEAGVFTVGPMTESELAEAITGPAAEADVAVPAELTAAIIDDLRDRSLTAGFDCGVLPLLSQVMFVMWQARATHGLTLAGYHRTGGIAGIVRTSAEAAYLGLPSSGRDLARRIFVQLTGTSDGRLTRHPATRAALRMAAGCDDRDLDAVLDAFTDQRLIIRGDGNPGPVPDAEKCPGAVQPPSASTTPGPRPASVTRPNQSLVVIAHEELLRSWTRLHGWLQPGLVDQALHRALVDDAEAWLAHGRDPSYLYQGSQLHAVGDAAVHWAADPAQAPAVDATAETFLSAGRRRDRRRRRVGQGIAAAMVVLAVAAVAAAVLATRNAHRVAQQHAVALSRQLAAQSEALRPTDWGTAQRLAAAALRVASTNEADAAASHLLAHYRDTLTYPGQASSVAFSPDGKLFAVAGNAYVWLWSLATGIPVGAPLAGLVDAPPVTSPLGWVNTLAFSPDGRTLVAGSGDGIVRFWSPVTGRSVRAPLNARVGSVSSVAFSPDGRTLAVAGDSGLRWWNRSTDRLLGSVDVGYGTTMIAFSPHGDLLAAAGIRVKLWNLATGRLAGILSAPSDGTRRFLAQAVAFSPDGSRLAAGGDDGVVNLWSTATRRLLGQPLAGHRGPVSSVVFSPDGKFLASGSADKTVRMWDPATGRPVGRPVASHQEVVSSVAFSPDGTVLISGGWDATVRWWHTSTGAPIGDPINVDTPMTTPTHETNTVNTVAFSPDGKLVAAGTNDGLVRLWNAVTRQPFGPPLAGHTEPVTGVAFSRDGRWLASVSYDKTVRLWDPRTGRPVGAPLISPCELHGVAFSPDGSLLAGAGENGTVRLWNRATGRPVATLSGHTSPVIAVAFSPDGKLLASAGEDATIRLWNPVTGRAIGVPLTAHDYTVWSLAFSPDGRVLASSSYDKTVRLWDLAVFEDPIRRLCDQASEMSPDEWSTYAAGETRRPVCPN
jgi:WD40 repeat protein